MMKRIAALGAVGILTTCISACIGSSTTPDTVASVPDIAIVPLNLNLPALQQPTVVRSGEDYWLIISGMTGVFHGFSGTNPNIYVYKVSTNELFSESVVNTDLPESVQHQITSVSPNTLRDGDTLYMIGGYYNFNPAESNAYTTLQTITSYNIPGMVNAIVNHESNLAQYVHYSDSYSQFKVTGGQLGKINDSFYLAFGQNCEGYYCNTAQIYTNTIYKFHTDPELSSITFESSISQPDLGDSGFRRRDYNLVPFTGASGNQILFAMGGPFTPGSDALAWTNGITFDGSLGYNDRFINQQANQYIDARLPMYSQKNATSYVATFSGLSNTYWSQESGLVYDYSTPYGNILDVISYNSAGEVQEYANNTPVCGGQPLSSCLYTGLDAVFIPAGNNYDSRLVLQLDGISDTTLVGYVYGGLTSTTQSVFNAGTVTNQVYAIYLTPGLSSNWTNITNRHVGVP